MAGILSKSEMCDNQDSEDLCDWLSYCKWNGTNCLIVDDATNNCPIIPPCPRRLYLWELILIQAVVHVVVVLLILWYLGFFPEAFTPFKKGWAYMKKKILGLCEDIAQACANYNLASGQRTRGGYGRVPGQQRTVGWVRYSRPDHVSLEMEPLVHRRSPLNAPFKEHQE